MNPPAELPGGARRRHISVLFMLGACFGFASMSTAVKLAGALPALQKVFFRNLISLFVASAVLIRNRELPRVDRSNYFRMFCRCFFGTLGVVGNYYAVDHMPLANAVTLAKMNPFWTILASCFLLGEVIRGPQILAVVCAFLGSVLVSKPYVAQTPLLPILSAMVAAFGAGTAYCFVRILQKRGERPNTIVFYFSLFSCLFCVPSLLTSFAPMTGRQVLCLLAAGTFASVGQYCMTLAYRYAPARELSAVEYTQVPFSALLGFFFFQQLPDGLSVLGYVLIFMAVVFLSWYNGRCA